VTLLQCARSGLTHSFGHTCSFHCFPLVHTHTTAPLARQVLLNNMQGTVVTAAARGTLRCRCLPPLERVCLPATLNALVA
jgi:hypothetical protein